MIELTHLQKIIDQRTAVDIDSLNVAAGEIAALVGPPGSGVEVLFNLLMGKTMPSAGSVRIAGIDPGSERSRLSRSVGVMFQEDALFQRLSPIDNLLFACRLYGLPRLRAAQVLEQIGLADQERANLEKMPGGLLRRLAFGRAIVHQPPALLLYDPFARCDEASITLLSDQIQKAAAEGTCTLILANDEAHLAPVCDKVHTLQQGRITSIRIPREEGASALPFKIPVKVDEKVVLVNPADILFADAIGGRSTLHTSQGPLLSQFTIGELEERLGRSGFFRAHRSYLVNLQHVKEVIPYTRNSFSLRLDDAGATEIPLSKSAAGELRSLLGY